MNIFLQIGIGLAPAVLTWIVFMFIRKCFNMKTVAVAFCSIAACITMILAGSVETAALQTTSMSQDDMLDLAYSVLQADSPETLDELINEYSRAYGYDKDCTLLAARSAALRGDAQEAQALYRKLIQMDAENEAALQSEMALVNAAVNAILSDPVQISYINDTGASPEDFGITATAPDTDAVNNMIEGIKESISEERSDSDSFSEVSELANLICETNSLYDNYISGSENVYQEDIITKAQDLISSFDAISEEYPEAFTVYPIRMSRLKAAVLAEDYAYIAENLDRYASYDELMIVSELYVNNFITEDDFNEDWCDRASEKINAVCAQLDKIASNAQMDEETRNNFFERVDMIKSTSSGDILDIIQSEFNRPLNDNTSYADKSKIYLQKSKIDRYKGNEESAVQNMLMAIDTAADSKDDNYSYPMCEISGIITGTGDAQNVLNIAVYVDQVINNSLTVRPSTDIFIARPPETDGEDYNGESDDYNYTEESDTDKEENSETFAEYMETQISLYSAAVNIGMIDVSKFPEISARIQLSSDFIKSESEAKDAIIVTDCFKQLDDFKLSKLQYSGSNIMLVCDNSRSMSGSVNQLKEAVSEFISSSDETEKISLVTFDGSIREETNFTKSRNTLNNVIDKMGSYGGTNIYDSILYGIEKFPIDATANNVMIVMTDGQDGNNKPYETIESEIGVAAEKKGITIYTLGMGSVDAEYLQNVAAAGSGDFVYASDKDRLKALYDIIHGQAKNQYLLEYTAYDTLTVNYRELTVKLKESSISNTRHYSLSSDDSEGENKIALNEGLHIFGLDTRVIHKGEKNININLKGSGFKADDAITLMLDGTTDYTLKTTYVDENTYSVVVPYGIAVGIYDLRITIGKDSAILPYELYIADENRKSITFGSYTFTASRIVTENDSSTLLSGLVDMNGWLHFNGDVRLTGDINNGYSITLHDSNGSRIFFNEATATGFAKNLAKKGRSFDVSPFNGITLYNDTEHVTNVENYEVARYNNAALRSLDLMLINTNLYLYPDRIKIESGLMSNMLPFQKHFVKGMLGKELFDVSFDDAISISKTGIYGFIDMEYEDNDFINAQFLNTPVRLSQGKFKWDALKDELSFTFMVKFGFVKETEIGVTLGWKNHYWDEILLHVDTDVDLNVSGVPVTLSEFSGGLKDMSVEGDKMTKERIWNSSLSVGTKIAVADLNSYFPKLSKYLGDISLVSTDDFELKLSLGQGKFSAKTDILFLEEIKVMSAALEFGNISYSNALLGLEDEASKGVRAYIKQGIMYDKLDGLKLDVSTEGEFNMHSRFFGIMAGATGELDLSWWLFEKAFHVDGKMTFGIYEDHYGRKQFVVGFRNNTGAKTDGKTVYVSFDGSTEVKDL